MRLKSFVDGVDDTVVCAAAAQVSAHSFSKFVMIEFDRFGSKVSGNVAWHAALGLGEHSNSRANLAWRAITALKAVVLNECVLQGMKPSGFGGHTFDRPHLAAVGLDRQCQAGQHPCTIDNDGACTTATLVAAVVRELSTVGVRSWLRRQLISSQLQGQG